MNGMLSTCDEYQCPCHAELPVLTARADAAERLLWRVLERCRSGATIAGIGSVYGSVDGLREWHNINSDRIEKMVEIADLTARRDRERAALEATERELAALTPASASSPGPG